jgi:hypothetical protein
MTPAMAAGVTGRLWEMADLLAVLEATEATPAKRGPYKKSGAAKPLRGPAAQQDPCP